MKKVGVINFHYAVNHGAVLESLALQTVLEKMGHSVEIINYRPFYQEQFYTSFPNPFKAFYWRYKGEYKKKLYNKIFASIRWFACTIKSYKDCCKRKEIRVKFRNFINKHLHQTKCFVNYKNLQNENMKYDVYICGSDQIWNPSVTFGLDPAYFLNFCPKGSKKIAYAASPSKSLDTVYHRKELKEYLCDFFAISLRESTNLRQLETIYGGKIQLCIDPTLLLDSKDYSVFEEAIDADKPYILVYGFKEIDDNSRLIQTVSFTKEKLGIEVVDISLEDIDWPFSVHRKKSISPGQFLSYFKGAKYIVTNSFHGTVFSIIYRIPFFSVTKYGTESRMSELLTSLHLKNSLVQEKIPNQLAKFEDIKKFLTEYKGNSLFFLRELLEK